MWSLAMMVLTSSILMMSLYMSSMQFVFQAAQQSNEALLEFVKHQQAVSAWGSNCRLNKRLGKETPQACLDAPPSGNSPLWQKIDWTAATQISNSNLRSRGVLGLSDRWKTIWYPGDQTNGFMAGIYFYPVAGSNFTNDSLKILQATTGGSLLHGTVSFADNKYLLNANQNLVVGTGGASLELPISLASLDPDILKPSQIVSIAVLPSMD